MLSAAILAGLAGQGQANASAVADSGRGAVQEAMAGLVATGTAGVQVRLHDDRSD
ncbi:hypothetical protein C791_0671 [Amycolatopsis azurea DSM 43854]|uniref:Uncharacterized protein n=1 Tax=Amycolatopsis azurea DSM 43854 TaxID=1238180 RepID=M2Q9E0_9PSEU|nr:hypothetical protein C791_0671 [Amycolatopsis azurea DSM 43854]